MIIKLSFLMLCLWSVCAFAGGEWIADAKTGCKVWNQAPGPGEGIGWSGSCANGKATGFGTLQWYQDGKPGSRYEGEYRDGHHQGKGTYFHSDGERYQGEWRDSQMHGKGTYFWSNGSRYEGEYRNNKRNGFGVMTLVRGDEALSSWEKIGKGKWVGEKFVIQGIWEGDGRRLGQECSSKIACEQQQKAEYARQEREKRELANRPFREGDNVCVMQWQGTGFCGNVDRVAGDRLKVEITRITCGGWVGQCNADPCSGGVDVGQSAQAKVRDFVWTEKYCVTSR